MKTVLLIVLQLGASGSDAYFTNRDMGRHFHENDPIARPFISSRMGAAAYFSATAAAQILIPRMFHKHKAISTELSLAGIADNSLGAAYSAKHFTERKPNP